MPSDELFYIVDSQKQDRKLHEVMLDNSRAERQIALQAMNRAMLRGLSREQAEQLYGVR